MVRKIKPSQEELEFANLIKEQYQDVLSEPKEKNFIEKLKETTEPLEDFFRAGLRGAIGGSVKLGQSVGGLTPNTQEEIEGRQNFSEALQGALPAIPAKTEEEESKRKFVRRVGERVGEILPLMAGNEAGIAENVLRSLVSGTGGQVAEELGFGPLGQTIGELPGLVSPGFKPRINPTESQREFVDFARSQKLTEEQIAPLLQGDRAGSGIFSRIAGKGKRAEKAIDLARQGRNEVYQNLKNLPEATKPLSEASQSQLIGDVQKLFREIPVETMNLLKPDMEKFLQSSRTNEDLAILWDAINTQFSKRGGKRLQPLKQTITEALEQTSPKFAKQFELTTDLGRRYQEARSLLTQSQAGKIAEALQIAKAPAQLAWGISTGNYPLMLELLGEVSARELGRELLINPRLQNLGKQMNTAIKNSSVQLAKSSYSSIVRELRKAGIDQETIDKLQDIDINDFIDEFGLSSKNNPTN